MRIRTLRGQMVALTLAFAVFLCGCPGKQESTDEEAASADTAAVTAPQSMFTGTALADMTPEALDIDHDGTRLFLKERSAGAATTVFSAYEITDGAIGERVLHYESGKLCRVFIRAHPTRDECLVASHLQAEDGVVDAIWRLTGGGLTAVPYAAAPGFPVEMPAVARYNLEPFYSWDGEFIIVPLHQGGFTVLQATGGEARFITYPPLPFATTGQAIGAVYSPDNRSLVCASFWRLEHGTQRAIEQCCVYLFDIASGEQLRQIELSWPVYQIASADPVNMPWLARGSRYPNKQTEFRRVPRLALLDPDSGKVKLQVFGGRPYWPLVLAPRGVRFTYFDQRRSAVVRLDRGTGAIDIDPRFYSESAQLFITTDGEVYAWETALLFRAEFSEHEQSLEYGAD